MPAPKSLPASKAEGLPSQSSRDRSTPDVFRMLDWRNLDSPPCSADVTRMLGIAGRKGAARLAVLVNTPRMLRAANVFAEQAGLQGAQVRVFTDSDEALAWLYKDAPSAILGHQWPSNDPKTLASLGDTGDVRRE